MYAKVYFLFFFKGWRVQGPRKAVYVSQLEIWHPQAQQSSGGIYKLRWSLETDSKESIPPAYAAWPAGTRTLFLFGSWPP
jgi:hypothetical protein